jgi:serine/threonine protein kinase
MLGKTVFGRYRLVRSLGSGSNAEVFLAEPLTGTGDWVVIKRMHDQVVAHPKFHQLFDAEVRSMANFSHPYAVKLLDASLKDPIGPCLVMEYVPGITLEALLRRHRRLDIDRVGRLLSYCCHALQAAHEAGIVHRDLKPSNLIVQHVGTPSESLKVMDFGFAGFTHKPHLQLAELTGRGPIYAIGTPGYVSPEMIRGDGVDGRSDLYSVAVILFEMLTGRLPFEYSDQDHLLAAHVQELPPRFTAIGAKDVPPGIEATVQLGLAKYPNERQQTARELVEMFSQALGVDYWSEFAPQNWQPQNNTIELTKQLHDEKSSLPNPYRIMHRFEAQMPERLAAAKLRGFVEDLGGRVITSEPGLIRMQIGAPVRFPDAKLSFGSSLFAWLRSVTRRGFAHGQEPVEVELYLQKPEPSKPRLSLIVAFCPLKGYLPKDARTWRSRCDQLHATLRQYLGA